MLRKTASTVDQLLRKFANLGFEWFAECDCCLGIVILFEQPVDECKQIWRLINRERLGLWGWSRLGGEQDGLGNLFVELVDFQVHCFNRVAEVKSFPFDFLTNVMLVLKILVALETCF